MERLFLDGDCLTTPPLRAKWTYWRPSTAGIVELGTLHGSDVALPTHFHDENQITFVLAGRRRFVVAGAVVDLVAGQGTLIPAGIPHRSAAEPAGVVCLNAYVPAGPYAVAPMMAAIQRLWRKTGQIHWSDLEAVIRDHREADAMAQFMTLPVDHDEPVSDIAARMGMSREGFSRMFSRRRGMPPHAYQLASRLNRARGLLRSGEAIAAVAADTGFTDQSHFGRWFRRLFGVTPGQYRLG